MRSTKHRFVEGVSAVVLVATFCERTILSEEKAAAQLEQRFRRGPVGGHAHRATQHACGSAEGHRKPEGADPVCRLVDVCRI